MTAPGRVVVLGVTTRLGRQLAESLVADGITPVGLIRDVDHRPRLRAAGVRTVLLDTGDRRLGRVLTETLGGADAVVLAAGTGTGGAGRGTRTVSPTALLVEAAESAGVDRFILVSAHHPSPRDRAALGADLPAYLDEKSAAERLLRDRDLNWCVLRPPMLTDVPATGRVLLTTEVLPSAPDGAASHRADHGPAGHGPAEIGRADCVSAIRAVLADPSITGTWYVTPAGSGPELPRQDPDGAGPAPRLLVITPGGAARAVRT